MDSLGGQRGVFCKLAGGFREKIYFFGQEKERKRSSFGCFREIQGELEGEGDFFSEED